MFDEATLIDPEDTLLAELEAEEAANSTVAGAAAAEVVPAGDDAITGAAAAPEPASTPEPVQAEIMIPKARFDEVANRARDLQIEVARLSGLAEGLKTTPAPPPAVTAAPAPDPAAVRLIAIDAEQDALWEKYDAGELTQADMRKAERVLNNEKDGLKEVIADRKRQERAPAPAPVQDVNGDLRLNEMTVELARNNEWIGHIPPDYLVDSVIPLAERMIRQKGFALSNDPAGAFRLRHYTVECAKAMGVYKLFAPRNLWPAEEGAAQQQPPSTPQPTQKPVIPTAKLTPAQVREKIELSRKQPPDLASAGTAAAAEIISAKDIENMSEDELAALSPEEQERLAPTRAR